MDLGINEKVAIVSGGSMGMGRATAELLAREGARVGVAALAEDKASIDDTVDTIVSAGGKAVGLVADMTIKADVQRAVSELTAAFGPPDIAVANVHGPGPGYFDDVSDEDFELSNQQMTQSMVYLARAVLPHMRAQRWGRIVSLNSIAAKEPFPDLAHILANTARAAVVVLNKSLSNEFAQYGITINTIGTGYFGTPRMYGYMDRVATEKGVSRDVVVAGLTSTIPARRVGTPEEMASAVAFLCSEGGGYVNGQLLAVDGGLQRGAW